MAKNPNKTDVLDSNEVSVNKHPRKPRDSAAKLALDAKVYKTNEAYKRSGEEAQILAVRTKLGLPPNTEPSMLEKPFADSLKPTDFDARNINLWQLEDDPSKLVRESKSAENQSLEELESSMREGETLFAEMRDKYGIKVVAMETRKEKNKEGQDAIFTLVDRIEGQNLSKIEHLPMEAKDDLENLYLSLGRHYYDAWKQNTKYWADCRSDQFAYGHKHGEKNNHFFLVDVDPEFYRHGEDKWHTIDAVLGSLCHDLIENENKFSPKVRFQAARNKLLEIINEILIEHPDARMLSEAKDWLESKSNKTIPQPGESTGKAPLFEGMNTVDSNGKKEQLNCKLSRSESLSVEEILTSSTVDHTSIPYYQDVYQDIMKGHESWGVTKKVKEYADYLEQNPETVANLPPIQFLNNKLHDGAHRISAVYLLSKLYPNSHWPKIKLKVDFYEAT